MLSAASLIGDFAATPGCDALAAGAEERFNHDEHEDYHEEVGSGWQTARAPYSNLLRKRSVLIQKYSESDARSRSPIFLVLRDDLSVLRVFVVESFFGAGIGGGTTYA
jgi:hypothetical protein